MAGYEEKKFGAKWVLQSVSIFWLFHQSFAFLVTVLELSYLLDGNTDDLRYWLVIGVQDQGRSFAILRMWIRLTRAVQFNLEVRVWKVFLLQGTMP